MQGFRHVADQGTTLRLLTVAQVPVQVQPPGSPSAGDPLSTVGIALLAYGLVQLLSKLMDKLPLGRAGAPEVRAGGFTEEDRKRLERISELISAEQQRVQRLHEAVEAIHEQTRWLAEQRTRTDPRDGEPVWNCRARSVTDQFSTTRTPKRSSMYPATAPRKRGVPRNGG